MAILGHEKWNTIFVTNQKPIQGFRRIRRRVFHIGFFFFYKNIKSVNKKVYWQENLSAVFYLSRRNIKLYDRFRQICQILDRMGNIVCVVVVCHSLCIGIDPRIM